jgi:hypothetical protein
MMLLGQESVLYVILFPPDAPEVRFGLDRSGPAGAKRE